MEILDARRQAGPQIHQRGTGPAEEAPPQPDAAADDEDGGRASAAAPTRLDKSPGMHRFTWDLRYPGAVAERHAARGSERAGGGPRAVFRAPDATGRGRRRSRSRWSRIRAVCNDGVTLADLREQFDHNMRVRELVSDVNRTVARLRAAMSSSSGDKEIKLKELSTHLITPPIRYSKPELQTQITYLYTITNSTDQKPGRDAVERYEVLRKELDQRIKELDAILK